MGCFVPSHALRPHCNVGVCVCVEGTGLPPRQQSLGAGACCCPRFLLPLTRALLMTASHFCRYPEFFSKFKMDPPRGVLFYGPPGTGKTLCARALANECSKAGKHVSFFMRKGADCLSKWTGESERMLRPVSLSLTTLSHRTLSYPSEDLLETTAVLYCWVACFVPFPHLP